MGLWVSSQCLIISLYWYLDLFTKVLVPRDQGLGLDFISKGLDNKSAFRLYQVNLVPEL